jgi:cytoskeletal protein CcmA (bactofilin family)
MSIFNKRSQEEIPPAPRPAAQPANRPAAPPPNPIEAKKEAPPLSTMPFKTPEPESTRGQASIGKAVKINGQIYSKEDLYVDGDVEGTIELQEHRLTIGPNGKVHSSVKAREVVILGNVQGNVDASDKLEIRKDARLVGDIKTARIIIEDGAYFKGSIDIVKPEQAKAAGGSTPPRPQQTTPAPVSNAQGAAAVAAEAKH